MQADQKLKLQVALKALATTNSAMIEQIERTISLMNDAIESGETQLETTRVTWTTGSKSPFIDRETLSVHWKGLSCFLGNTLLLQFFERIARSQNRYVAYGDLLNDVWRGQRDAATIRGVVKRLRDRLSER